MQTKTIKKRIETKLSEWIESVNDTELRHLLKKHVLVSGGSIASMYLGEDVKDYDVYLTDRYTLLKLVHYYADPFAGQVTVFDGAERDKLIDDYRQPFTVDEFMKHIGKTASSLRNLKPEQIKLFIESGNGGHKVKEEDLKKNDKGEVLKYQPVFFSPNAISLTDDIQIVNRFWGTADEVHKTFDFIHPTNYFTFDKGIVLNQAALESLLTRQLRYQGSLYPITSIIRARKFIKRNWNIGAGELMKIMFQISLLDLQDMDVLEDQLIGVDVAYFEVLIKALREQQERDPAYKITPEHFNSIIDKVFNEDNDSDHD